LKLVLKNSYIIEFGVCYLCLCEKSYPKKLAFQYLDELQKEFQTQFGAEMQRVARPYAFVKFGKIIISFVLMMLSFHVVMTLILIL
jgi:hypothetical protein